MSGSTTMTSGVPMVAAATTIDTLPVAPTEAGSTPAASSEPSAKCTALPAAVPTATVTSVVAPRMARTRHAATATIRPTAAPANTARASPSKAW